MQKELHRSFYFIVPALFLFMVSPHLFTDGMFMDGVIYAAIARNMAVGIGSFWRPEYTETLFPQFHEHPPLALGLESVFFRIFGDHLLIERIYSLLSLAVLALVVVAIWRRVTEAEERKYAWLPLLFLLPLPLVVWSVSNNLLENTLVVFTSLAVLAMISSTQKRPLLNISLAAFWLLCAILTKGPVALFPFSFFFFMMLFFREYRLWRFVKDTLLLVLGLAILALMLFLFIPESLENLQQYFQNQVVKSLSSVVTVNSRFHIMERLLMEFAPALLIAVIVLLFKKSPTKSEVKTAWKYLFLGLGFSAVLPIMVSLKQRGFYIIPALPFFALSLSLFVLPRVKTQVHRISARKAVTRTLVVSGYFLLTAAVALNLSRIGRPQRDSDQLADVYEMCEILPPGTVLNASYELGQDFGLQAYLYRYGYFSLDRDSTVEHEYLLLKASDDPGNDGRYQLINSDLTKYALCRISDH